MTMRRRRDTGELPTDAEQEFGGGVAGMDAPVDVPVRGTKGPSAVQRVLQFQITPKKVPLRELQQFSRQLAVFIKAGVPLIEALNLLREETSNKLFKSILDDIAASLESGATLSDAASGHTEAFPAYYLGILRAAELTGN